MEKFVLFILLILLATKSYTSNFYQRTYKNQSIFNFSGKRPSTLGVHNGKLTPCTHKSNCVSSQSTEDSHKVQPFYYKNSGNQALKRLISLLEAQPRCTIITQSPNYIHAEFKTSIMGFVDDVEFYIPSSGNQIQVRSASRIGHYDLGVNRKRIERLRKLF
ncbi:DUF1499 domain-containing protein [Candidatus Dependentiae bacterium]|nr:DUF1499 domain-containing protein [Candidatus Dependentiae bacterium]